MENIFINGVSLEEYIKENYISKDKIKDKIKHAKEVLGTLDNEQDITVQKIVINYLEEILEEN